MNITRLEQETIVNFNAAEDIASVYTADPVYMRKLDKLCEREPMSYKLVKQDKDGKWYEMPKRLVRFATTRIMTDEQKEAAAERMRKMQAESKILSPPKSPINKRNEKHGMVSGSKTTLCDYSVLFSLVIYQGKTARSGFEKDSSSHRAD